MKTVVTLAGTFGLLLSIVACGRVGGAPNEVAQSPDRSVTLPAPLAMEGNGELSARLSEYVFLHKSRHENAPVHVMAVLKTCP